jgi:hypothetical protein
VAVLCLAFAFTVFIDPSNLHRLRDWIILHGNDSPSKNIVLAVWYTIIAFFVIWAVINAAIPLAQLSRLPALYMPFLIVKVCLLFGLLIFSLFF